MKDLLVADAHHERRFVARADDELGSSTETAQKA